MSFFTELKRRNVIRMGMAYALIAWVLLQAADFGFDLVGAPEWVVRALFVLALIGLPAALVFAWIFELTPEGIRLEKEISAEQSITAHTARKMDRSIIVFLGLAVVLLLAKLYMGGNATDADPVASTPSTVINPTENQGTAPLSAPEPVSLNSIAVLPFANRSTQENDQFFSDGIHDDLLTQLAKIDDLKVISRTSVMEYRNTTRKIPEIAAELGVARILEGGVQRAGNRVRINAQLIDVATDEHLWAETFDREMTIDNIFDIQTEITRQIVTAIRGELSAREQQLISARPTNNLEAWEAYQHMQAILRRPEYSLQKYLEAEPWAQKAVELDPKFAAAWAQLSEIQAQGIWTGWMNTLEQRDLVRTSLQNAVELAPDDPLVILAQADYQYRIEVDYPGALELIKKAQALMPGYAPVLEARALVERRLGLWEQSIGSFEQSLALDPLNGFVAATMMETLAVMNDWARLELHADRWLQRLPDSAAILGLKADALLLGHGNLAGARALLDEGTQSNDNTSVFSRLRLAMFERDWDRYIALTTDPDITAARVAIFSNPELDVGMGYYFKDDRETARSYLQSHVRNTEVVPAEGIIAGAYKLWSLSQAYALLGEHELASRYMREARAMLPTGKDHMFGPNIERDEIWLQAWTGDRDTALEGIERLLEQYHGFTRWELYLDPRWDFFRDDDRFNELIRPANASARPAAGLKMGDDA